jgi:hypothetical protein
MGDYRAVDAILAEINALIAGKASGTYFISGQEHSAWLRLREGQLVQVACENHFNDDAVPLLMRIVKGIGRFVPGPVFPGHPPLPGEEVRRWLSAEHVRRQAAPTPASRPAHVSPPAHPAVAAGERSDAVSAAIERVALSYLGPIAPLVCAEAWTAHSGIESVLAQIATNLIDQDEVRRFLADAHAAIKGVV